MPDRQPRAAEVVGCDVARAVTGEDDVDTDQRRLRLEQLLDVGIVRIVDREDDDAVGLVVPGLPRVGVARGAVLGPLAREQEQVVALCAECVLQAHEHLEEEWVLEVGVLVAGEEDDPDQLRALLDEGARSGARRILELACDG